ncbi:unnamed protein product [Effrenium voratum]|nr:unnamed protein product [Effrenium voratum]
MQEECLKACVQHSLWQVYKESKHLAEDDFVFVMNPMGLRSNKDFKANSIKLFPIGSIAKLKDEKHNNVVVKVTGSQQQFVVQAPKAFSWEAEKESGALVHFFWVKATREGDKVNMQWATHKSNGLQVPILVNKHPIAKHTQLLMDSEKLEKEGVHEEANAAKPAKKKPRTQ